MALTIQLSVTFAEFGRNYYVQNVTPRRRVRPLIEDANFESVLMPLAAHHFSNGVVGLNDQFRFLNQILVTHLSEQTPQKKSGSKLQQSLSRL